jgi:cation:H+ antiporter
MEVFNAVALFVICFFILIKSAEWLVRGATGIAKIFQVSTWFIGAVIISLGTSVPELSVSLASTFSESPVGISAILGSNIFNVLVGLGLAAIFYPVIVHRSWIFYDFTFHIGATLFASALVLLPVIGPSDFVGISQGEGLLMALVLAVWILLLWHRKTHDHKEIDIGAVTLVAALGLLIVGFVGVFLGGRWVVDGAITISHSIGVHESIIGLTLVAFGTSLPELTVSFVALLKKRVGIGVGNIIGSNIINLLGVLGVTAAIQPIILDNNFSKILTISVTVSVLPFLFMFVGKRYTLSRFEGVSCIVLYILFVLSLFT